MGCTPSNQQTTSVMYGRDKADGSPVCDHSRRKARQRSCGDVAMSCCSDSYANKNHRLIERRGTITITEAETQTCQLAAKEGKKFEFGPMQLWQRTMTVLLVFVKEDSQSDGFWWASERAGYHCHIEHSSATALQYYQQHRPDVVIIDSRPASSIDAVALCRSIRVTKTSGHAVLVAVTNRCCEDKEELSILPLLTAGFNKRFTEDSNVGVCMNELLSLELCEVRTQIKLCASLALLAAVEKTTEAVQVTSEDCKVQYVNPAYKRLFGYTRDDWTEHDDFDITQLDKFRTEICESVPNQLKKGMPWDGTVVEKTKSGDSVSSHCQVNPVMGQNSKIRHLVSIRRPMSVGSDSEKLGSFPNGTVRSFPCRKESIARIHSMTIEAPITKVISIINTAQENCPIVVAEALDKVLDILRSSELYSPYFGFAQMVKGDQMTSDLVGGLMTMPAMTRRMSNDTGVQKPVNVSLPQSSLLSPVSADVQRLLSSALCWDFDIIKLEKMTQNRTLLHLGMTVLRSFGVPEFLQISEQVLMQWLQLIEANYHACNPYHNSTHAADVMHATAYFLRRDRMKMIFDQLDETSSLLASIVHDLDHPGKTNSFLVNAGSELAVLYNDLAVLESHHVSLAFQLTQKDPNVNIFKNLNRETFQTLRQQMVDMVLATEMTKHFEHLNKFVSIVNPASVKEDGLEMSSNEGISFDTLSLRAPSRLGSSENRTLIRRVMIKCSDVSNPVRPLDICREWARRISDEYCAQTDEEKKRGLPVVMPVFDRRTCNVPKSQTSFIDFFINDMFDTWDSFCSVPELMANLQTNYEYWKAHEESAALEIAERLKNKTNENEPVATTPIEQR